MKVKRNNVFEQEEKLSAERKKLSISIIGALSKLPPGHYQIGGKEVDVVSLSADKGMQLHLNRAVVGKIENGVITLLINNEFVISAQYLCDLAWEIPSFVRHHRLGLKKMIDETHSCDEFLSSGKFW